MYLASEFSHPLLWALVLNFIFWKKKYRDVAGLYTADKGNVLIGGHKSLLYVTSVGFVIYWPSRCATSGGRPSPGIILHGRRNWCDLWIARSSNIGVTCGRFINSTEFCSTKKSTESIEYRRNLVEWKLADSRWIRPDLAEKSTESFRAFSPCLIEHHRYDVLGEWTFAWLALGSEEYGVVCVVRRVASSSPAAGNARRL
jgi:hypothetical protein